MGILKNLFGGGTPAEPYTDPILGTLVAGDQPKTWTADARSPVCPFAIEIGGTDKPDDSLLDHARELYRNPNAFLGAVNDFLSRQKEEFRPEHAAEIDSLSVERVGLWWIDRPDDGMIFFKGGEDDRLWRCDYIDREPRDLGFDS